jgi:UDP-N-acetyl-D-mannosaminuronate dehydrogenase
VSLDPPVNLVTAAGRNTRITVAFIRLGITGRPMAANLVEACFEVVGYNRSQA